MKKILFVLLILCMACICSASVLDSKGKKVSFNLINNGTPVPIVIPDDADKNLQQTAEEAKTYFRQIFGIDLPVMKESEYEGNSCISLGKTELVRFIYENVLNALNEDGICLRCDEENLYIFGGVWLGDRNALYTLLEEDLGCRWWDRAGNLDDTQNIHRTIPNISEPVIKFVPRWYNPPFIIRDPRHNEMWGDAFIKGNRIHWLDMALGTHSSFDLVPPEKYFESHPEYFSEENGKRVPNQVCWSHPDIIKIMTDGIRAELIKTGKNIIGVSPQDGVPPCDCEKCRSLSEKEGTKAAPIFTALNTICQNLEKDFPNVKIVTLAYLHYVEAPKTIKPHKNLLVQVCSDTVEWYKPFATYDEVQKFPKDCKGWLDTGANVMVWTYVQNLDHYLLPYPNYQQMQKNLRILRDWKVLGDYAQGAFALPGDIEFAEDGFIKSWVFAHLMWNPDLDYKALREEFITNWYGESAEPILEYEKLLDALYDDNHKTFKVGDESTYVLGSHPLLPIGRIRYAPNVELYTDEFADKCMALSQKALDLAKTDEMKHRVKLFRASALYLNIGRNVGWTNVNLKFTPLKYDSSKRELYMSWWKELKAIVDEYGITCLGETERKYMKNNGEFYMTSLRDALLTDMDSISVREIKTPWKFSTDPESNINPLAEDYDISKWTDMPCNTNWETVIGDYDGDAWYKRSENFTEEEAAKKHIFLVFGAVDESATVYVNGKLVIEHTTDRFKLPGTELWNKPFCADVKPFLKPGENQICVKVHDERNAGGIWEPVKFLSTDQELSESAVLIIGSQK